jgi:hypothetical protein
MRIQICIWGCTPIVYAFLSGGPKPKLLLFFSMRPAGRSLGCGRLRTLAAAGFICARSTSRGHADERAGDPLHRAWVNANAHRLQQGLF